jgi:hypothetical protein
MGGALRETHHPCKPQVMGIAALHPSTGSATVFDGFRFALPVRYLSGESPTALLLPQSRKSRPRNHPVSRFPAAGFMLLGIGFAS